MYLHLPLKKLSYQITPKHSIKKVHHFTKILIISSTAQSILKLYRHSTRFQEQEEFSNLSLLSLEISMTFGSIIIILEIINQLSHKLFNAYNSWKETNGEPFLIKNYGVFSALILPFFNKILHTKRTIHLKSFFKSKKTPTNLSSVLPTFTFLISSSSSFSS